jgi:hypothetical protein
MLLRSKHHWMLAEIQHLHLLVKKVRGACHNQSVSVRKPLQMHVLLCIERECREFALALWKQYSPTVKNTLAFFQYRQCISVEDVIHRN